ncbi:MAG: carboxypeptidase regulatory-like domain-containing protein [Archangiaceae bacterium]|nr:carboxypeptidase regulatory-like domain-containing protein [Archangiaceae bacterium]
MSKLTFRAALVCAAVLAGCTRDYSLPDPPELGTVKGELGLADGSALGGVPVQLAPVDGDAASQTSDATSGAFNFVDLPPGLYTLRIAPAGYYEVQRIVSVRSGTAKDLGRIVLTPLAQPGAKDGFLTGKVQVNGGGDVTGAEVEIIVEGTQQAVTKLAVGGSGEFTQRLAPNTYQLKVTHPFYVSPPPRTGVVLADNQMLDLRPQPLLLDLNPARIRGRVMKERDLSASRIEAQGAVVSSDTGATATADSAGNFDLQGLPAGMRSLTVTLAGFHDSAPLRLVMVAPAETKMVGDVELLLDRGDLSGEVSMKDNTPLQNVTASLDIVASLDGGALDGGSANPYSAAVAPSSSDPTRGAFVITRVPVGRFSVKVSRENYITANSAPVDVAKDRTTSVGQLDLVRIQGQFNIDDGDATNTPGFTRRTFVTLQLAGASNASEYRVSETDPTLSSVAFQPFGALPDGGTVTPGAIPFTLSSGDGTKTIYLQYKDSSSNVSGVLVANVVLDTVAPSQESLVLEDGHDFTRSSFALLASVFAVDLRGTGVDNASGVGYVKLSGSSALGPDGQLIAQRDPYTPTLSFTRSTTQDGPQTVYAQFIDNAGNASAVVSDDVTVDTVPPSGSMTIARGPKATLDGVTNTPLVDLQFAAAAEPDGGYVQVKLANENGADLSGAVLQRVRSTVAWFIDPTEGNRTVHYVLVDAAGNAAGQAQQQIRYDTTAPSGTLLLTTPNPTSSLSAGLSLSATDFGSNPLSPDAGLTLSEDPTFSTAATVGPMPFVSTRAFTFSPGDGPKTVYARFRDAAGNDSTSSLTVTVDQTAPLGSISLSGVLADGLSSTTSTAAATVTVNVQQNGASLIFLGNETLADCTTAGPYQPLTGTTLSAVPLTGAASPRQVRACLKDAAGNVTGPSGALTATISLDTTAPSGCSLALQGYARGGAPAPAGRTALADITATVSGCIETPTEMFLTNSAVTCTPTVAATWVPFSASRVHTLTGADGTTTVRGCVRDAAHNTSALNAVPITLDTTPPTLSPTVTLDLGAAYVNAAQVTSRGGNIASLSAVVSGATEWSFSETNPPPAAGFVAYTGAAVNVTFAGTGPRTVYAQFRDDVNNVSLVVSDSIEIDVTAPTGAGGLGSPSFTLVGALADGTASSVTTATTAVSLQLNVEGATEYFLGNESLVSCPASGYLPLTGTTLAGQTLSGAATPRQMRACFRDAAGNVAGPITDTIALDGTAPSGCALTVNGFKRDGSAAPADRTALFAVTVAVAGCAETPTEIYLTESTPVCSATVSLPWGTYAASVPFVLSGNDGTHTVRGCVRDAAGNVSTVTADATVLDTTGPSGVSVSINGNAAWLNKSQVTAGSSTLSVSAAAAGATDWAIAETQNPTNWLDLAANNPRPLAVPVTADGLKRVYAVFRDDLQNTSVQVEDTITADITPPTGLNATGNPSIVVSGTLGDGTSSSTISATPNVTVNASVEGATEYFISNESLSSCPASGYLALGSTALPYTLSGATSPRTVRVCFRDAAGNAAPYAQGTLALDTTTATGCTLSAVGYKRDFSPAPAGKTAYNDTRVSVAGCSETPVEVFLTETPVACVSSASFVWQAFSPPVGFTLSSGDGLKTIRGCVRDAAGNVGSVTSADLTLDTTGPSALSVVVNGGATWVNASQLSNDNTTLSIQGNASGAFDWAADETSSPSNFLPIATNPRALSIPVVSDGTRTIRAVFRDDLQNPSATVPETSIRIDTTPPAVTTATLSIVTNGPVADFTNSPAVTLAVTYPSDATETLLAEHAGAGTCAVGDFALSPSQSVVSTYAFTLSPADGPSGCACTSRTRRATRRASSATRRCSTARRRPRRRSSTPTSTPATATSPASRCRSKRPRSTSTSTPTRSWAACSPTAGPSPRGRRPPRWAPPASSSTRPTTVVRPACATNSSCAPKTTPAT